MRVFWAILFGAAGMLMPVCVCRAVDEPAIPAAPVPQDDKDVIIKQLKELWDTRRTEIQTADIQYRMYYSVVPNPPLTQEQLERRIDEFGLRTSQKRVTEFLKAIGASEIDMSAKVRHLWLDGPRARYEHGSSIKVHDPDYLLQQNVANKVITVHWTGTSNTPIPPINWLREIPPASILNAENLVTTNADSSIGLEYDSSIEVRGNTMRSHASYKCDAMSGIPVYDHYVIDGTPTETQYQLALVTDPDGVVFPGCSIHLRYQKDGPHGLIKNVDLTEIIDAQFNRPLPPELFVMPKPAGFTVLDQRAGENVLGNTNEPVANTKSLVSPVIKLVARPKEIPWHRRAFFIVNGLALIALGIWLWRRVSLKEPKH